MSVDALREKIRVNAQGKKVRGRKKVWQAPTLEDFAHGTVLSFDQTLTKTGWVYLRRDDYGLQVLAGGRVKFPPSPLKGFEETFAKADWVASRISGAISLGLPISVFDSQVPTPEVVIHEMPAVQGYRLESSLMAAREVRRVAGERGLPVAMVSRQQAYANLVGAPSTDKTHGTARVNVLIPRERRNTTHWNQDVHDAVLLGLQWLYDKKRGEQ